MTNKANSFLTFFFWGCVTLSIQECKSIWCSFLFCSFFNSTKLSIIISNFLFTWSCSKGEKTQLLQRKEPETKMYVPLSRALVRQLGFLARLSSTKNDQCRVRKYLVAVTLKYHKHSSRLIYMGYCFIDILKEGLTISANICYTCKCSWMQFN